MDKLWNKIRDTTLLAGVWFGATTLVAQTRPQMVWEGEVDGVTILYVRASKVEVEVKEGAPVQKQRFHISDPLPANRQELRVEVNEGRGSVAVVDQPRLENSYTAAIRIEDRQTGSAHYAISLYWDRGDRQFEKARAFGRTGKITWSGMVDGETIVACREQTCTAGADVLRAKSKFSGPLPDREVQVTLDETQGRGDIRLVEQPSEVNGYAAKVRIHDARRGLSNYSFRLTWDRPGKPAEPQPSYSQRSLVWSGHVDGRVRVTVQGGAAYSEAVSGQPVGGEHAWFEHPLPKRSDLNPTIKKLSGRGKVEIAERPSTGNNYRLIFEINDSDGGVENYEIEVSW
jgi:hypothetical protein